MAGGDLIAIHYACTVRASRALLKRVINVIVDGRERISATSTMHCQPDVVRSSIARPYRYRELFPSRFETFVVFFFFCGHGGSEKREEPAAPDRT